MSVYSRHSRYQKAKDLALTMCFILGLALVAARLQGEDEAQIVHGPFYAVDGDTLAKGQLRLRLTGIDAPELQQTCNYADGKPWPCGKAAREELEDLLHQGEIECRGAEKDRYGRRLVTCYNGNMNLNAGMVGTGMAISTSLLSYQREQWRAEGEKAGIWAGSFQKPSRWRDERELERKGSAFLELLESLKGFLSLKWL